MKRCTKQLVASDCMEFYVACSKGPHDYIGLTCQCGDCKPQVEKTDNLSTCPFCGEPLVEIDENYEPFLQRN